MAQIRYLFATIILAVHFGCGVPEKQVHQPSVTAQHAAAPVDEMSARYSPAALESDLDSTRKFHDARKNLKGISAGAKPAPAIAAAKEPLQGRSREESKIHSSGVIARDDAPQEPLTSGDRAQSPRPSGSASIAIGQGAEESFAMQVLTPENTEKYGHIEENPIKLAIEHPVSTFSIDVDTGSYSNVRRFLNQGSLPPHDAVRAEELINYFPYAYAAPSTGARPFAVHTEMASTPWNHDTSLLRVGIKGREIARHALPPANLVFLIDVSGSMNEPSKLPLLKSAFELLAEELRPQDKISIVVYAGASGVVLQPTTGDRKDRILASLQQLSAGGSTHGAAGIELAYRVAQQNFQPGGINRVLLATDGDFNVGVTNFEALKNLIEQKRRSGVSLSTLGFGTGNYNDQLMEQLADAGNGNYSYIDTLNEARKALVDEFTSTMAIIARDVKIQIEFNPALVAEYRLIGYENRMLKREDFSNDKIDAGEIGAGHSVTALYEFRLHGQGKSLIDSLRYQPAAQVSPRSGELALLRLRHKTPDGENSELMEVPIAQKAIQSLSSASTEFRFAVAVAAFGQELKGGKYLGNFGYREIRQLAQGARAEDRFGYRAEFLELVTKAEHLTGGPSQGKLSLTRH